jgi:hypothetical protein
LYFPRKDLYSQLTTDFTYLLILLIVSLRLQWSVTSSYWRSYTSRMTRRKYWMASSRRLSITWRVDNYNIIYITILRWLWWNIIVISAFSFFLDNFDDLFFDFGVNYEFIWVYRDFVWVDLRLPWSRRFEFLLRDLIQEQSIADNTLILSELLPNNNNNDIITWQLKC